MQMIRQNHNGIYLERVLIADADKSLARGVNVIHQQSIAFALREVDGEKPCRAWNMNTPIIRHVERLRLGDAIDAVRS
jgi:hypothetical protein